MNINIAGVILSLGLFLMVIFLSRKSFIASVLLIILVILLNLVMVSSDYFFWLEKVSVNSQEVSGNIIINLNHCTSNASLDFCRILYNKPVFLLDKIINGIILQFSQENILSFINIPFRSILTLFCYIGILGILIKKMPSNTIKTSRFWIFAYGVLGLFGEYNANFVVLSSIFLLFLVCYGFYIVINMFKKAYAHFL